MDAGFRVKLRGTRKPAFNLNAGFRVPPQKNPTMGPEPVIDLWQVLSLKRKPALT